MGLLSPKPETPRSAEPEPEAESAAHRHAAGMLAQRGIRVERIIRVNTDSILYLGSGERPMTAWLSYEGARLDVFYEPGFPA